MSWGGGGVVAPVGGKAVVVARAEEVGEASLSVPGGAVRGWAAGAAGAMVAGHDLVVFLALVGGEAEFLRQAHLGQAAAARGVEGGLVHAGAADADDRAGDKGEEHGEGDQKLPLSHGWVPSCVASAVRSERTQEAKRASAVWVLVSRLWPPVAAARSQVALPAEAEAGAGRLATQREAATRTGAASAAGRAGFGGSQRGF